jgi:hypothetical protein
MENNSNSKKHQEFILQESIAQKIIYIRGQKVILDKDLALLYGVTTSNLNKAVTRNIDRFPEDFMFRLTKNEFDNLKFQFGTSSWGGTRKLPRAFTEHGILMISSVLKNSNATKVLKEYLAKGYSINFKKLSHAQKKFKELQNVISFFKEKTKNELLQGQEQEILSLLEIYSKSLSLLNQYDNEKLNLITNSKEKIILDYKNGKNIIKELKKELIIKNEASNLFYLFII